MDRREHLRLLLTGSLGAGLLTATSCSTEDRKTSEQLISESSYGRTEKERLRDQQLASETFFSDHERATVEVLCDIIIPADEVSAGATEAGVPDFIEFMMKDIPSMQVPTRGGIMWLDNQCRQRFGKAFVDCSSSEQLELVDQIAYPDQAKPEMGFGVRFFNRMRDLTATGFYTSEMGVNDLGYEGNHANLWDGVPQQVLERHGLAYDARTLETSLQPEERARLAEWDEEGNLIRI